MSETPRTVETIRDGKWVDEHGCCKVCDGEIPYGHDNDCYIYKLERELAQARAALRDIKWSKWAISYYHYEAWVGKHKAAIDAAREGKK